MEIPLSGGCISDDAPVSTQPDVLYSENMRWRRGRPETIGLQSRVREPLAQNPITVTPPTAPLMTIFHDRKYIVFGGDAKEVTFLDWETGVKTVVPTPEAGESGPWWFLSNESVIIGARACLAHTGRVYTFNRATLVTAVLPNSPNGVLGGGIVAGVLFLVGVDGFAPGPNAPAELTVRWSARRSDDSSSGSPAGPFGFEDWTPSDRNASGEFLLESGTELIGGGGTSFGGVAWTDKAGYLFRPRDDLYTFTEEEIGGGLLANQAWCEADNRIWWFDQARSLNVYDGGSVSQVINPMRMASVELMDPTTLSSAALSARASHGEIILRYRDIYGSQRQIVHNYRENVWYPWRLNRVGMTDRYGPRPAIGVTTIGEIFFDDLASALDESHLRGEPPNEFAPFPTQSYNGIMPPPGQQSVEPFDFRLSTTIFVSDMPNVVGLRALNLVLSHTYGTLPGLTPLGFDYLTLRLYSYDEAARDAPTISSDEQEMRIGTYGADFRSGGRALRLIVLGNQIQTFVRFGPAHLGAGKGHHG